MPNFVNVPSADKFCRNRLQDAVELAGEFVDALTAVITKGETSYIVSEGQVIGKVAPLTAEEHALAALELG